MSYPDFLRGRFYPASSAVIVAAVCLQLSGCVLRWGEAPIASITPTVGLVLTYPVITNIQVSAGAPVVSEP